MPAGKGMPKRHRLGIRWNQPNKFNAQILPVPGSYPRLAQNRGEKVYLTSTGAGIHPLSGKVYDVGQICHSGKIFRITHEDLAGCDFAYVGPRVFARIGPTKYVLVRTDHKEWPK